MENKNINLSDLDYMDCGCPNKHKMFQPVTLVKRVSSIISPSGKEEIIPVDAFQCTKCNKIPNFISEKIPGGIPDDLKPKNLIS